MTLANGTRLGPYELTTLVGMGGMGEVYRARDTRLDRVVAVKVLPRAFAADPDRRARLEREARAVSSLNHRNICALFDVGNQDGVEYLVMEHLEGETLAQRLNRGPLPTDQLLRVAAEVAAALEHAHRQGIIHRDLKPANVMLTKGGAKLLDFGIARLVPTTAAQPPQLTTPAGQPTHTPLTGVGMLVGTLHYMAPEQLEARAVDARADLFSLGAVIYEMATGIRAFEGGSQASVIAAVLERQPAPITSLQPLAPPALERLVRTCLAKDPDDRWQSAHDVRLALAEIADNTAPAAAFAAVQRRRGVERAGWAAAVAVLLLAGLSLLWVTVRGRSSGATVGGRPLRLAVLPPVDVASSGPLALSPDGKSLAFVGWAGDGVSRLFVRSLEETEARQLPGTDDASLPFWSPDGKSLGFFARRRLLRIEVAGGPPRVLAEISDSRGGCWTKDDVIVFAPNPGDGLYRLPAEGGVAVKITQLDAAHAESSHRWPTCLPDGKHVIYLVLSGERERLYLETAAIDGPHGERLAAADSAAAYAPPGLLLFVRGDSLLAQRFDPARRRLSGEPQALATGIWRDTDIDGLYAFSVAPGGTVAYRRGGNELTRLVWFDREGHEQEPLGEPGAGSVVALSPDGRRLARSVTETGSTVAGLWLLDLLGQGSSRLTFNRWNDIYPVWRPDGRRLAFTSDRDGRYNLYEKAADGSGEETPLLRSPLWDFPEDWTRDGRMLAFTRRDPRTKGDVWVLSMPQRTPRVLLQTEADELQPRLSPDARFLAYVSDESGRTEVYVQTMPPSAAKWQVSTAGGFLPQWRRDGKELYYLAPDQRLMAAAVDPLASTFSATPPRALFATRVRRSALKGAAPYVATADGQRFLIDSSTGPDLSAPIQIVLGAGAS